MKRAAPILMLLAACGPGPEATPTALPDDGLQALVELGPAFVGDPAVRRAAMERSLVDPTNGYSRLRLQNYATAGRWEDLPVRNFFVRPIVDTDIGAFDTDPYRPTRGEFEPVFDGPIDWTHEALLELGRDAFHNYPLELSNRFSAALADEESVDELGLWRHEGRVGGLVRVRLDDGSEAFAATCSTCHASVADGALIDGRANAAIDNDAMQRRLLGGKGSDWGPGAADVTADDVVNPVAITDLRPIRHQSRLHWAATLYNSPEALAVRIETLMITSANEAMRPPREIAVALAYYLWSLGESPGRPDHTSTGAELFDRECASCHGTLDVVPLETVGTDTAVGASEMRGTGTYRVPSLRGVTSRSQFMHQGQVKELEQVFDPARLEDVPGHPYGTNLDEADRSALLEYLSEL